MSSPNINDIYIYMNMWVINTGHTDKHKTPRRKEGGERKKFIHLELWQQKPGIISMNSQSGTFLQLFIIYTSDGDSLKWLSLYYTWDTTYTVRALLCEHFKRSSWKGRDNSALILPLKNSLSMGLIYIMFRNHKKFLDNIFLYCRK